MLGAIAEEQNLSVHPVHIRTAIPDSLRYTTTMDGGSVDFAGAKIDPYILRI